MATKKARILVASAPQAYPRLFAILSGHEQPFVSTLSDAQVALKGDRYDLIMLGVHFDGSKMFDLLQYVRADERYARVPVVCFRGVLCGDAKGQLLEAGCEAACKAMDATFFDLAAFSDDSLGNAAVRKIIDGLLVDE